VYTQSKKRFKTTKKARIAGVGTLREKEGKRSGKIRVTGIIWFERKNKRRKVVNWTCLEDKGHKLRDNR